LYACAWTRGCLGVCFFFLWENFENGCTGVSGGVFVLVAGVVHRCFGGWLGLLWGVWVALPEPSLVEGLQIPGACG
jgi:hypothetical protein